MSQIATDFPRFPDLALELRQQIWECAVPIYVQDLIDRSRPPTSTGESWAERRLLALASGNAPDPAQLLRLRVMELPGATEKRVEENDFETLVNFLPISAVCHEARPFVIEFCRHLVTHVKFGYYTSPLYRYEQIEPSAETLWRDGEIRELPLRPETGDLERLFWEPTKVTVELGGLKSAAHLVDMLSSFLGKEIRTLSLTQLLSAGDKLSAAYWADSGAMPQRTKATLREFPEGDPTLVCITRDRKVIVSERFSAECPWLYLGLHLLKLVELFDACAEKLPKLEHLEVLIELVVMEQDPVRCEFETRYDRDTGILAVTSSNEMGWPNDIGMSRVYMD